jgi:superfamily II DNA or RNA helicase
LSEWPGLPPAVLRPNSSCTMFVGPPTALRKKLWKHQAAAMEFAVRHLNRTVSPCLIRMPTGTGKTGVIACLTRLSNTGSSLVLTPWAHLRNQMVADLEKGFWDTINATPNKQRIVSIFPSTAEKQLKSDEPKVIIATFTTLNDLRLNHTKTYEALAGAISLVLVDEGHYEPAVEWGKSVKGPRP